MSHSTHYGSLRGRDDLTNSVKALKEASWSVWQTRLCQICSTWHLPSCCKLDSLYTTNYSRVQHLNCLCVWSRCTIDVEKYDINAQNMLWKFKPKHCTTGHGKSVINALLLSDNCALRHFKSNFKHYNNHTWQPWMAVNVDSKKNIKTGWTHRVVEYIR